MSDERHPALEVLGDAQPPMGAEARIQAGAWAKINAPKARVRWGWSLAGLAAVGAAAGLMVMRAEAPKVPQVPAPSVLAHQIEPGPQAALTTLQEGPRTRLRLTAGSARFTVARLLPNEAFVVETPWAEVAVLGTQFSVTVAGDCTEVQVLEGRVSVVPTGAGAPSVLTATQRRSVCKPAPVVAQMPTSAAPASVAPVLDGMVPGQAAVYEGMRLFKAGRDLPRAAELLSGYAQAHPEGAFLEEALFYWSEVTFKRGQEAEARRLAERFLVRFPKGYRADRLRTRHTLP
jgi:hypothetical protein